MTAMPKNIKLTTIGRNIIITYRWFHIYIAKFVGACIVWDVFMFWFFCTHTFSNGSSFQPVLLLPLLAGLGMTYVTLMHSINKTDISITDENIEIKHYPFPWYSYPNSSVLLRNLIRAEVDTGPGWMMPNKSASVHGVARNGSKILLVKNLRSMEQAKFIKEEINKRIGIKIQ